MTPLHAMLDTPASPSTAPAKVAPAKVAPPPALDLEQVTREAGELGPGRFGFYLWLDAKLADEGFPPTSPWWRQELERLYSSRKRWGVFCGGRGGGKSTTLVRVAVDRALFDVRHVPPGQRWIWPFISASTSDARARIREISSILAAIGIDAEPTYPQGRPTIELVDARGNPIAFVALASTIAGVSGPSTIGCTIDEEAKLRDGRTHANPSTEILASLVHTFRSRPGILGIRCSSAWTTAGSHAAAVAEGDTDATHVARIGSAFLPAALAGLAAVARREDLRGDRAGAALIRAHASKLTASSAAIPTWVANPTIGAVMSHAEVDALPTAALDGVSRAAHWLRECASVPLPAKGKGDEADAVARAKAAHVGLLEANRSMPAPEWATGPDALV